MAEKLPFEKIFPYFSYRWRYEDGQYSPYAPFTRAAFESKEPNVEELYKKGHNTSIVNNLKVINLKDIPSGGPDVVAIDILYRESISSTVYILKTIDIPENERNNFTTSVQINKRSFEGALPANQLSRPFDNVPLKAKSQEFTANRLMYGNYLQKYDFPDNYSLNIKVTTQPTLEPKNGPSVKSNRSYNVGVVYLDKFGRHSNIVTQAGASGDFGSSFDTDFSYDYRTNLSATITSAPPSWATHFKYYVKDTSNEHFNLTAFNVYNDGNVADTDSDNVYLQFNSSDRNKITEDTILIPRRHNFDGDEVVFTDESRHPVLEIENEAPNIVKNQVNERAVISAGITFRENNGKMYDPSTVTGGAASATAQATSTGDVEVAVGDEAIGFGAEVAAINRYLLSQDEDAVLFDRAVGEVSSTITDQTVDVSGYGDRLALKFRARNPKYKDDYDTELCLVDSIRFSTNGDHKKRNIFVFTISTRLDEDGNPITGSGAGNGLSKGGHYLTGDDKTVDIKFFKLALSEEGQDKLKGSFYVKVPREVTNNTDILGLPTGQTPFDAEGNVEVNEIKELAFETEPLNESNLDLYWESTKIFPMTEHGNENRIDWANCIATRHPDAEKVCLESTKIFDKFNSVEIAKGTRVLTPDVRYAQERRKAGIIFSGLYNSKTGINELNQFVEADGITKELEPNYGGIQKLYALDTNLIAFTEDKIFRVLADKDALFNADDGVNVTSTNLVLGQAMAYGGNYGISTHPESLVFFNNQFYFTDAKRGAVMQLTPANGQLFPISSRGMTNFFRDRLHTADKLIGMYDGHKKLYVLSMQGYDQNDPSIGSESIPNETSNLTIGYSARTEGWPSRYSFIPESGVDLNNKFYTFKDGKAYIHHDNSVNRNTFYGTFGNSEIELIFNDDPMAVKEFLTLSYEGTSGWDVSKIDTESDDAALTSTWPFVKKENKYFAPIVSQENYYGSTDQSLGSATADDGSTVYVQGTRDKSGIKGFYNKIRLENDSTSKAELFAVNTENFISQT